MKNIRKIGLVLLSMVVASLLMIGCGKSNEDELNAAIEMSYKKKCRTNLQIMIIL